MHTCSESLSAAVRRARIREKWTQAELAEKIDTSIRTVQNIEKNYPEINPELRTVYRLIRTLNIDANIVFYPEHKCTTPNKQQLIHMVSSLTEDEAAIAMQAIKEVISLTQRLGELQYIGPVDDIIK